MVGTTRDTVSVPQATHFFIPPSCSALPSGGPRRAVLIPTWRFPHSSAASGLDRRRHPTLPVPASVRLGRDHRRGPRLQRRLLLYLFCPTSLHLQVLQFPFLGTFVHAVSSLPRCSPLSGPKPLPSQPWASGAHLSPKNATLVPRSAWYLLRAVGVRWPTTAPIGPPFGDYRKKTGHRGVAVALPGRSDSAPAPRALWW